jgi:hypothetical protein
MFKQFPTQPGLAVLAAAVLLSLNGAGSAGDKQKKDGKEAHSHHDEMLLKCAEACNRCQRECDACSHHCLYLVAQGKKEHIKTQQTCQDCAVVCATSAQVVARKGPFTDLICKACAEACNRCGKACAHFNDDPDMKRCTDECRRCEQACREMLSHVAADSDKSKVRVKEK